MPKGVTVLVTMLGGRPETTVPPHHAQPLIRAGTLGPGQLSCTEAKGPPASGRPWVSSESGLGIVCRRLTYLARCCQRQSSSHAAIR